MKVKNILVASVALLGFVSCEKSEGVSTVLPSDNIIRVSAGVTATRAGATTDNLIEFGISAYNDLGDANFTYSNVKVTKAASVWSTSEMMLWKNATDKVFFTVYAPYKEGFDISDTNTSMSVLADQTTEANLTASDFLLASNSISPTDAGSSTDNIYYNQTDKKLHVNLAHYFSKFLLTIKLGSEFNAIPFESSTNPIMAITINGVHTSITQDAILSNKAAIKPYHGDNYTAPASVTANGVAKYEAIIVPQPLATGELSVIITIGDKFYLWKSTNEVMFDTSKTRSLTLNVGKEVVTADQMTIGDWEDVDGGDLITE